MTDALFDFLDDDAITVPLKSTKYPDGHTYSIPSPDAETGARLQALAELTVKVQQGINVTENDTKRLNLNDAEEREFSQQVLGSAYAEMVGDGVSWVRMQRLTQYAFVYWTVGAAQADKAAAEGAFSGKAPARNRAQRRAAPTGAAPKAPRAKPATKRP